MCILLGKGSSEEYTQQEKVNALTLMRTEMVARGEILLQKGHSFASAFLPHIYMLLAGFIKGLHYSLLARMKQSLSDIMT